MIIGGVAVEHPTGPVAHSDGDVLLHAVTDALLGAIAQGDIGELFPDDDPANDGRDSADFLREAVRRVHHAGFRVVNLDGTVVAERPKLKPIRHAVRANLARLLEVPQDCVHVKGKTHEGVDAVGRGEAIEAYVTTLLQG